MGISAREFMSQNPPPAPRRGKRRSALARYASELEQLRREGYTLAGLQEFLSKNDVDVQLSTISIFLSNLQNADAKSKTAKRKSLRVNTSKELPLTTTADTHC